MFASAHIPTLFKRCTLKLVEVEDEVKRVAEGACIIEPFTPALARELGEEIAGHLFTDEDSIRAELKGIDMRVRVPLQRVKAARHADLTPAVLENVIVKDCKVARVEDTKALREWLAFTFTLVFDLSDRITREFVIHNFGSAMHLTFEPMQRELLDVAPAVVDAVERLAPRPGGEGIDAVTIGTNLGDGRAVTLTAADGVRLRSVLKGAR